jgi:hypothetical protein
MHTPRGTGASVRFHASIIRREFRLRRPPPSSNMRWGQFHFPMMGMKLSRKIVQAPL